MSEFNQGDRVRLKQDHSATGAIDEVHEGVASIVWDISGCVGDGPEADVELIPIADRVYEKIPIDQVKEGSVMIADGGFTCLSEGQEVVVKSDDGNLYVDCAEGMHCLDGQHDGDHYIGFKMKF